MKSIQPIFNTDSRGSSINLQYALVLGISLILLAGVTGLLTESISDRSDQITDSQMNIIEQKTATDLQQLNRHRKSVENQGETITDLKHRVEIPNRMQGSDFTVSLIDTPSATEIIVASNDPDNTARTTRQLPDSIPVTSQSGAPADNVGIEYDGSKNKFRLVEYKQ